MVVAKRQRKGKVREKEQSKNLRTRVRTSGETNMPPSCLALICTGQALVGEETKHIKRGSQDVLRPLFWGQPTLTPPGVLSFVCRRQL